MGVDVTRIAMEQFSAQWATFRRPRSLLGSVAATIVAVAVLVVVIALLLMAAVIAVPVGLALAAAWWVRARLPRSRGDGRRNVRVRSPGVS